MISDPDTADRLEREIAVIRQTMRDLAHARSTIRGSYDIKTGNEPTDQDIVRKYISWTLRDERFQGRRVRQRAVELIEDVIDLPLPLVSEACPEPPAFSGARPQDLETFLVDVERNFDTTAPEWRRKVASGLYLISRLNSVALDLILDLGPTAFTNVEIIKAALRTRFDGVRPYIEAGYSVDWEYVARDDSQPGDRAYPRIRRYA